VTTNPARQLDLGLVPSNVDASFTVGVANPYGQSATATLALAETPYEVLPGALPRTLAPGQNVQIACRLAPPGVGTYSGSIVVDVTVGNQHDAQTTNVTAQTDPVVLGLDKASVDFGDALPDSVVDRTIHVSNASVVSTAHLTGSGSPSPYVAFTNAFPIALAPGQGTDLTLRFAPTGPSSVNGSVGLLTDGTGGGSTLPVAVSATSGGEEVTDFGLRSFDANGDTAAMSFQVPGDAISFMIEGKTDSQTTLGLRLLTGPGGKVYENEQLTGSYIWAPNPEVFTAMVPNTDRADVQLVPGGGTYQFKLLRYTGTAPSASVRAIVQRRPRAGTDAIGTVDLNVFLANAIPPTAATAAGDTYLQSVLSTVDGILNQQGLHLGAVDYYDITDPTYDDVTNSEFGPLLALSANATKTRLNLFFVRTALGNGVLGVSGMIAGPARNGTDDSGVMSLYDTTYDASFVGLVAAHEIGHYIGLYHTVEQNGQHDDITDTLECPASGTDAVCPTEGGGYLMHWQAVGGTTITHGEGLVIRGHPLVGPRLLTAPLLGKSLFPPLIQVDPRATPSWCGTCRGLSKHD
jgi:hypothetical protein